MLGFFDLGALGALDEFGTGSAVGGSSPTAAQGGGPGWKIFGKPDGYHPPIGRKRNVREVEQDVLDAFRAAEGDRTPEAVIELKRAAATALSVAERENDAELAHTAREIISLRRLELGIEAYLVRVGEILQQQDDLEAFELMARLA